MIFLGNYHAQTRDNKQPQWQTIVSNIQRRVCTLQALSLSGQRVREIMSLSLFNATDFLPCHNLEEKYQHSSIHYADGGERVVVMVARDNVSHPPVHGQTLPWSPASPAISSFHHTLINTGLQYLLSFHKKCHNISLTAGCNVPVC